MLIGANVAVPAMTPKNVPYRGSNYMSDEIKSIFVRQGEEGAKKILENRAEMGYGLGVATKYDFYVTEESSVEWPLFADGFSRFGYIGLFIYSFLFAFFLASLEKFTIRLHFKYMLISFLVMLFISYNGVLSYMFSYYDFIKLLIFRLLFLIISTIIVLPLIRRATPHIVNLNNKI